MTRTRSASWCLASRSVQGAGAASASCAQRGVGPEAQPAGEGLGGRGPLHLEGAQLVEHHLDLVGDARQPAGLAREDQVLLLLGLEQEQVQQLLLPPEQRRQVLVVHVPTALPSPRRTRPFPGRRIVRRPAIGTVGGASSRSGELGPQGGEEMCRGRCRSAHGPPRRRDVSPARALATERPLPEPDPARPGGAIRGADAPTAAHPGQRVRSQQDVDALVTEHLPLAQFAVNAVASRISLPGHVSRDDLLSCAHVALVEVARRFDPAAGASFATYALARLQGAVLDELRSGDWASRSVRAAARRTDAAADALAMTLGRPPTQGGTRRQPRSAAQRARRAADRRPPGGHGEHRRRDRQRPRLAGPAGHRRLPRTRDAPRRAGAASRKTRSGRCPTGSTR